jgi:galactokinase
MTRERLAEEAKNAFQKHFSCLPDLTVLAPGRANLIGEHTDYNDGHVLPVAIDRFTAASAANRSDRTFRLYTANLDDAFEFDADDLPEERPAWASYMMGVIVELEREGFKLSGKDIIVHGNVPLASGLSSSASLEMGTATAIERLEGLEIDDGRMVQVCRRAEHHFAGVQCGPMDQFASRACKSGHAGLLDCRSLTMMHEKLMEGVGYLSIYSGIPRSLDTSEYNERQASCKKAVEILREADPNIRALRDGSPELVESQKQILGDRVYRRAKHVVKEQRRVFALVDACRQNDLERAGKLLVEGHMSLSNDYEVSLPLLDEMVDWLCQQPAVVGARLTGAGFGGSLICLVESNNADVEGLAGKFREAFGRKTPEPPEIWKLTTMDGAKYQRSF